jgi:hypothetical protein
MAIGDPIDFGRRRADTWVKRFDAPNGRDAVERDLLRYPLFEVDFPRSWFWNLWSAMTLRLRRSGRGIGLRPERYGILALADRFNDVFRVGVGSAGAGVEVPYSHLALVAGFPLLMNPVDVAADVQMKLDSLWRQYVDPIVGIRVALYRDAERDDGRLSLFLGQGIFLPTPDEKPIGRVEIALADGSGQPVQPCLPDGRPAGLYRGQSCLAMADSAERAPAICSLLDDRCHIYLLQFKQSNEWRSERVSGGVHLLPQAIGTVGAHDPRPDVRGVTPPEGYDCAFEILRDGTHYLDVRVIRDTQGSALLKHPPPKADVVYEVIGFLTPDRRSFGRQIDRWWIDLDAEGSLIASASGTPAKTIIFAGGAAETYLWRTNRFQAGSDPAFFVEPCRIGGRDRTFVGRADRKALGFLVPPATPRNVGFDGITGGLFQLDWLDYAGAVEPVLGEPVRLAAASASALEDAATAQAPSASDASKMEPGREFFIGPLCVRVSRQQAPA